MHARAHRGTDRARRTRISIIATDARAAQAPARAALGQFAGIAIIVALRIAFAVGAARMFARVLRHLAARFVAAELVASRAAAALAAATHTFRAAPGTATILVIQAAVPVIAAIRTIRTTSRRTAIPGAAITSLKAADAHAAGPVRCAALSFAALRAGSAAVAVAARLIRRAAICPA